MMEREQQGEVRTQLYRLLLDEDAGVASSLVPRMLADPDSLTPEIRWCLLYLVRGIVHVAARNNILASGCLLDTLAVDFESARCQTLRLDRLWSEVVQEDPKHWMQRYESTDIHYSLEELLWLSGQLDRLWQVERQRFDLKDPPLQPIALRKKLISSMSERQVDFTHSSSLNFI